MAPRRPGSATSASDNSQSPRSDLPSPHFSPVSNASAGLHPPSDDGDSPGSRSARSTPSRSHFELSRSYSAGKGGCWTCRLRRKKCDEQRSGDSCRTCIRLNIDCLGWGIKRPEWMRDKQQVQAYRAKITDKLRRENRIRGQPRQAYIQQAQSLPTTPTVQPSANGRARPRSFVGGQGHSVPLDWSNKDSAGQLSPHSQQPTYLSSQASSRPVSATNSPHIPGLTSLASFPDQTLNALDLSATLPFPLISPISQSPISMPADSLPNIPYTLYSMDFDYQSQNTSALQLQTQPPPPPPQQLSLQQQHQESMSNQTSELVLYFFENVKSLQFKLFGDANDVINVIYSIIMQEPRGAVASAVCAIASLHHSKMRQATGYEPPEANPEHSFNKYLYDQAFLQLVNSDSKHRQGAYSESDAIAALILTSFALLSDGWTDWSSTLQIAKDWLANTGILTEENPRRFIASMGSGSNFAAKTTIWLDIMSSITTMQPPRFMNLYQRLFDPKAGYSLQIEQVTGFSDDVLYAIAQISTLASWKSRESSNGRLSVRELIRRGDIIEQVLRRGEREDKNSTIHVNGIGLDITFNGDTLHSMTSDVLMSCGSNEDIRRVIRSLFRETAVLYLHTVLSDPNPGVQEITAGVDNVIQLLQQLPPSKLDQTLVFPTCFAGYMTDNQGQRQYLISRIQGASNVLNLQQTRSSMEGVWQRRDLLRQAGTASWETIEWRESLREHGLNLLLV